MTPTRVASSATAGSQTLARGLTALEILAEQGEPVSIGDLADRLGVHRSNAYRILRTLEERRFVLRDESGLIRLGPRLAAIASGVAPTLQSAAMSAITDLAEELGMTAFVAVLDHDEAVTLATREPTNVAASIARNPSMRHRIDRGAPGHAIESALTAAERTSVLGSPTPSPAAAAVQRDGYSLSSSEVIDGVTAIAVPLRIAGEPPAAVAVVHFRRPEHVADVVDAIRAAADRIARIYH